MTCMSLTFLALYTMISYRSNVELLQLLISSWDTDGVFFSYLPYPGALWAPCALS